MIGLLAVGFTYLLTIYLFTMPARKFAFSAEFMSQFDELHKKEIGDDAAPEMGYPDTGSGWYSKKLSYLAWYKMNNGQRC